MNILGLFSLSVNLCSYTSQITKKISDFKKDIQRGRKRETQEGDKEMEKRNVEHTEAGKTKKKRQDKSGN